MPVDMRFHIFTVLDGSAGSAWCTDCGARRSIAYEDIGAGGLRIPGLREFPESGDPAEDSPEWEAFVHRDQPCPGQP